MLRAEDAPRPTQEAKGRLLCALTVSAKRVGHVFHAGCLVRLAEYAEARRKRPKRGTPAATFRLAPIVLRFHFVVG